MIGTPLLPPGYLPIDFSSKDGTPKSNIAQNKQFKGAVREIEKRIGRPLSQDEEDELHQEIHGQNYGYWEIVEVGVGMFGYRKK